MLVFEGDAKLRDAFIRTLESAGLTTLAWHDAEAFLRQHGLERAAGACCLVSDVHLPRTSGLELQLQLIERWVQIPIVSVAVVTATH